MMDTKCVVIILLPVNSRPAATSSNLSISSMTFLMRHNILPSCLEKSCSDIPPVQSHQCVYKHATDTAVIRRITVDRKTIVTRI